MKEKIAKELLENGIIEKEDNTNGLRALRILYQDRYWNVVFEDTELTALVMIK